MCGVCEGVSVYVWSVCGGVSVYVWSVCVRGVSMHIHVYAC